MKDNQFFLNLYRMMLRIRLFEESLVDPILNRDIHTPCHLYSGQEAIAVGVCAALSREDYVFGNHRSHGHFLAKGGSMKDLAAEVYCRESGCSRGRGGSMHLIDPDVGMMGSAPIVAGTIPLAVGAALASSIRGDGHVSVSFFGDGATGEGGLYESLNFAALKRLPVIFACENNLYATHMPIRECRVSQPIGRIAEPFGIEVHTVDGNDVLQVHDASRKAVDTCRRGDGPVFMEFMTYRFRGHVGPDDNIQGLHTDIRPPEEVAVWMEKDPIKKFERYLNKHGILDNEEIKGIKEDVSGEVQDAVEYAMRNSGPLDKDLRRYVFA
ncbi:MAG TPA: thiamine pyrophosphate-dependent dehydrogenase E1 component subunit alpha [Deltaproteobacteria bacterium]|nr:thiamine pyrophosphate-dependent dehydrogenase E1 component subunit alpha [Deltaproteobacteria bacterium]